MRSSVSVSIFIHRGTAFVATVGDCEIANVITEPIYTVDISSDELTAAIEKVFRAGTPKLHRPPGDKLYNIPQPLLKIARVSSWKKLAQGGTSYDIAWYSHEIILSFTKIDKKGRFVNDISKIRHFPPDTHIEVVVQTILDDIYSRPELL